MLRDDTLRFQTLTGIYEPSGIRQLADGRFIVVEDEEWRPLSLLTIAADGRVESTPLLPPRLPLGDTDLWRLDDLEGVAVDQMPATSTPSLHIHATALASEMRAGKNLYASELTASRWLIRSW